MSGFQDFPVPNPARIYDYLLGGNDYFPPDREAAEKLIAAYPEARTLARANRRFLTRAVWYLAEHGIGQYIDLGTGLPTSPNVHEVARQVRPGARVVYVDNDPVVTLHSRVLCATSDGVAVVDGDIRDPRSILANPVLTAAIDFALPVAILCVSVFHFIREDKNPREIMAAFRWRMAPGSYLVLSHAATDDTERHVLADIEAVYDQATAPRGTTVRSRDPRLLHRAGTGRAGPCGRVPVAAGYASQGREDPHPGRSRPKAVTRARDFSCSRKDITG